MFANAFLFLVLAFALVAIFPTPKTLGRVAWYHWLFGAFFFMGAAFLVAGIYVVLLRYLP